MNVESLKKQRETENNCYPVIQSKPTEETVKKRAKVRNWKNFAHVVQQLRIKTENDKIDKFKD